MNLFILRHGEAGTRMSAPTKDFERALTVSGRKEVEEVARALASLKFRFDRIVTSPLKRARETADIVAEILEIRSVDDWDELKPEGSRTEFLARLSKLKASSSVLAVGHEPYLSSMVGAIIGGPNSRISLKKAGIAKVVVTSFTPKVDGELRWLLTPRQIRRMG